MTFRHPMRNQWDANKQAFEITALEGGRGGAIARVMLKLVPAYLDVLEAERDLATPAPALFNAVAAVAGLMIENAIEHHAAMMSPRAALHSMLSMIERGVLQNVVERTRAARIILPGQ